MRWSFQHGSNAQLLISNIICTGLVIDDKHQYLLCFGLAKHEIRRYQLGATVGTVVAGGNGEGNHFNQLSYPWDIFIDRDESVYISD